MRDLISLLHIWIIRNTSVYQSTKVSFKKWTIHFKRKCVYKFSDNDEVKNPGM